MTGLTKPIEVRRLYQQIADQIRELIDNGEFPVGTRLPAERDLAQKLGVSRPSLREALIALEIEGSVDIRMSSGVYITAAPSSRHNQSRSLGDSPSELMQARAAIEGAAIVLSACRITDEALAHLRQLLDEMKAEIEAGNKPLDIDRQFHLIIAEQSGNSILSRLVTELFDERHSPISAQLRVKYEDRETWHRALDEHIAIVDALEAKDPLLAQAAMHTHLDRSRKRWIET